MTLKGLENKIAEDWVKEQTIQWKFRNYKDYVSVKAKFNYVYTKDLFNWELTKCQELNLVTKEQSENLVTMLNSKNQDDVDLGRRLLNNFRTQRLKQCLQKSK